MTTRIGFDTAHQREQLGVFIKLCGLPVRFSPIILPRTTEAWLMRPPTDPYGFGGALQVVMFSETALLYALRGVVWHDEPEHCRTWGGGTCRCDLGDES